MNLVFNLESVDELKRLAKALEEVATLQARMNLEEQIRSLNRTKERLSEEIRDLRKIREELSPNTEGMLTEVKKEEEEDTQALRSDSESITRRIVEIEENERAATQEEASS